MAISEWFRWAVISVAGLAVGCSSAEGTPSSSSPGDEPFDYVPPGKADDYRSTTGLEYSLTAADTITLPAADMALTGQERLDRARELVKLRFKALSFFVYQYLAQKSRDDKNYGYGGFRTTIRQQTFKTLEIEERGSEPGVYDFIFEAEVGGPKDLLSALPLTQNKTFELILPKLSTGDLESGSYSSKYKHFNPEDHAADSLTQIAVDIETKPQEPDAYPDYKAWFSDGLFDVAIVVGGDYNDARYDIVAAKDIFRRLKSDLGLTPPVASFDDLRVDSGPFVGTLDANGKSVKFEVSLIHPDMSQHEGVGYDGLIDAYKSFAKTHDLVIYDGHAGYNSSYSGVVVHYNPRHALAADDFVNLELPDKYQLFFFNGCKTYTSYADAMYQHPAKNSQNLDVITTVNFSWLSEMTRVTTDLLGELVASRSGDHTPRSYDQTLAKLNRGQSWDVIYGVHGLSDNPRLSPYADLSTLCSSCDANSQCPGADNLCIKLSPTNAYCAAACTDDSGCPEGYACRDVAAGSSNLISAQQCVPAAQSCGAL